MEISNHSQKGLHQGLPVLAAGEEPDSARAAMLMVHGRGASAKDILTLAEEVDQPGFAYLAPQAAGGAWYPNRFLEPTSRNEPWLSSALAQLQQLLAHLDAAGIPPERTILLGFSQGGCLALEYAARNARRYGGLVGLSAGLIGAQGEPRQDQGRLEGTPVFLGCSDVDPHIPKERVMQTARVLEEQGGQVNVRLYRGMGHTVNQDELDHVREMMSMLLDGDKAG